MARSYKSIECVCLLLSLFLLILITTGQVCPEDIMTPTNDTKPDAVVSWTTPINYTCDPMTGTEFAVGPTPVMCTSDSGGSSCTFNVIVNDDEKPTIMCPVVTRDDTLFGMNYKTKTWTNPTDLDNVDVVPESRQCTPASGESFRIGTTDIICEVSDEAGNKATCTWQVIIQDDEPPAITNCPMEDIRVSVSMFDATMDAIPNVVATWQEPIASDNSGEDVMLSSTYKSGHMFFPGVTTVMYTAADNYGNTGTCSFDVNVVVQPPDDHIFIENPSTSNMQSCLTVVWPESADNTIKDYSVYFWRPKDENRPDDSKRLIAEASTMTTYRDMEICQLLPGELYTIEVVSGSNIRSVQNWTKPNPPVNVDIVPGSLTSSSYTVSWQPSAQNVEQYLVQVYTQQNVELLLADYVPKLTDRFTVESVLPGSSPYVEVYAIVGSGDMRLRSDREPFEMQVDEPGETELIAYNTTESTIEIAWLVTSATESTRDPFMLYINPAGKDQTNYMTRFVSDTGVATAMFEGLQPNTEHSIRLISNLGLSLETTQKTRPERVSNMRPMEVLSDSITLAWDPPESGADSYRVYISPSESLEPITEGGTSYKFPSLSPETEYFFKVVSYKEEMTSVPQSILITAGVTKAKPPPPVEPTLIVMCVLAVIVVLLIIIIIAMCIKNGRKTLSETRRERDERSGSTGRVNPTVSSKYNERYDEENYEVPETDIQIKNKPLSSQNKLHDYQNSRVVGPSIALKPTKVQGPPFYDTATVN